MKKIDNESVVRIAKKVIRREGVMGFSMRDITKEGQIANGTLYRIAKNKSDILIRVFLTVLSKWNTVADNIEFLPLNKIEQYIVWLLYPSYLSEFKQNHFDYGVTFLGCNHSVLTHASDEVMDELQVQMKPFIMRFRKMYYEMLAEYKVQGNEEFLEGTFQQLITAGRGSHVMSSNQLVYPYNRPKVTQSNIALITLIMSQLDWGMTLPVREHNIMLAMRTLADLSASNTSSEPVTN